MVATPHTVLRSRFLWKLSAGYFAVILVTALTIGFLGAREVRKSNLREVESRLRLRASLLAELLRPALDTTALQTMVRRLGPEIGTRITWIDPDGRVLADSQADPTGMENHNDRPEVQMARSTGRDSVVRRRSTTTAVELVYLARPLFDGNRHRGTLRVAEPETAQRERFVGLEGAILAGVGVAAVMACILGLLLARQVTGPLRSMTQVAEAVAGGDYHRRVRVPQEDEIGRLADTFNSMADQLRLRMETINTDRNKLRAILGGMVEGVIAVDGNERILHMNDVAGMMLNLRPEDCLGQPIWEVTRLVEVNQTISATIHDGGETITEIVLPGRPDDQVLEVHASPLRDHSEAVAGAILVLHDVTQLRKLEAVRRDFVANVSHELKTPLAAIRGLVETMLDDPQMPAETERRFLGKISAQTMRLSTLVGDLLSLSRIETRESPMDLDIVDMTEVVEESTRALFVVGTDKGLTMVLKLCQEPVHVRGEAESLRQVVDNLVDNAVKYTPPGGTVTVVLRQQLPDVILEVSDTGIGIEPLDQDRIFERFYRVDKARSRELGGTGLGLSIVKNVILRFGGEVAVESTPGVGSTFRVKLPYTPRQEQDLDP